jgi:threonine dehydratase
MDVVAEVQRAHERLRPHVRETELIYSASLSQAGGASVYCKLENQQLTGSFKVRGALNKLLSLSAPKLARGVVAASTGNHGLAVAHAARELTTACTIFVTENASPVKIQEIEKYGVKVRPQGQDCVETEAFARKYAARLRLAYISPYNDPQVIGGQGTIAVELSHRLDRLDAVFVSLGGGGLVSGIAGYLKSIHPDVQVIGCSPENSQVMIQSVKAGKILDLPSLPTLSDGTAGGIEPGAITFDLCCELVDEYVTVTEDEIKQALRDFVAAHHQLIEGAAAVAVASFLKSGRRFAGGNVVIVICGGNISQETLRTVV